MSQETTPTANTITFAVEGMTCGSCVRHVGEALTQNFDRLSYKVDLANSRVTVAFEPGAASEEAIARVMDEAGYPVRKVG